MASEKSTVYVVLALSESFSSMSMLFPPALMSGDSSCGGETTTFSVAFSILINSLKRMCSFLVFTPVAFSVGDAPTTRGGVSSYQPPSGLPIRAQAATNVSVSSNRAKRHSCQLSLRVRCVLCALSVLLRSFIFSFYLLLLVCTFFIVVFTP